MTKYKEKIEEILEMIFKIMFLIEGFLQICCFTFGNKIISIVLWPTVFLGIIILCYRFINYKKFYFDKKTIVLILFCISSLISAFLQRKYGIYANIRVLAIIVFQFFILFYNNNTEDINKTKRNKNILEICFLIGTGTLTIISFITLILKIDSSGSQLECGMVWGRLFGAYWDPNIAAVVCCYSIVILLDLILNTKNIIKRILLGAFIIMQMLYISFSDSRSGLLCLTVAVVAYSFLKMLQYKKNKEKLNKLNIFVIILISITIGCSSLGITIGAKKMYNYCVNNAIKTGEESSKDDKKMKIDRGYNLEEDISNRRFDIWKSGLEIFSHNIIFGVSRANILHYAEENFPETYIVNNSQKDFDSMHNLYIDILVSQGLIGFILMMTFFIWIFIEGLLNLKNILYKLEDSAKVITLIVTELAATLVMTEIIYLETPISMIFWVELGYIYYFMKNNKIEKDTNNGK